MSTGAQDLAAAGQQLHVTVERFQADVATCLSNISAARGTQDEKKQQTEEAVSVINKTSRQIRKSFRPAAPSASSAFDNDGSSVTSTISASGISVPQTKGKGGGAPVLGKHVVTFANAASGSAKGNGSLANIRVFVDADTVAAPGANQSGNGAPNGDLGAANHRDGAPVAKNNPLRNGVLNGGAGGVSRNASRNGSGGNCYNCDQPGHLARNCPSASARPRAGNCYNCDQPGHLARDCPSESRGGNGFGTQLRSMSGTIAKLCGDHGYIKSAEGGEDFFFRVRVDGIRYGDKVDFKFDPKAHRMESYHRRKAFSVSVVHASERQGVVTPRDARGEIINERGTRDAARGNSTIRQRADEEVTVAMRRLQLENANMKQKVARLERRQNGSRGGPD